jgi:YD repeat-containing protein
MRKTLLFALFAMAAASGSAQYAQNNALSFPSVNNEFAGKTYSTADVSVDMFTGTAQVHVPICALAAKDVSIPVSLDYVDGRGVKVQEVASQVGLGWQLNAGGSISRVVRGFPDEQPNGYVGTGQWGQIITAASTNPNYTNFNTTISLANYQKLSGISQPNNLPVADGEPDLFFVKTPFFSFQFVLDKDGHPVFSNYQGFRIIPTNFVNSATYQNSSFEVIDDQGTQFYFGNTVNSTEMATDSIFGQVPPAFITSWYLTQMVSYNGKDVINFTYQASGNSDYVYNYSYMETQFYASGLGNPPQTSIVQNTGRTIYQQPKFISTIVSSLGEIDFNYSYTRLDDAVVPSLNSIVTKGYNSQTQSNSNVLQTYHFGYDYFNSPYSDPLMLRLQLDWVSVTGNTAATSSPQYIANFGYNTTFLPARNSPYADYWGYCIATPSPVPTDFITGLNRSPNLISAQSGILTSVTTLSGSTWNIYYELNSYSQGAVGGLRVNQVAQVLPTGENLHKTYQYAGGQIYSSAYSTLSVITETGTDEFVVYFSASPYITNDINGNFVGYSTVTEIPQNGGKTVYTFTNFNDFPDPPPAQGAQSISFLSIPTLSYAYKRGLVKEKEFFDGNGTPLTDTKYTYAPGPAIPNSAYAFRVVLLPIAVLTSQGFAGQPWVTEGFYSTPIENYLVSSIVQTDYQQYASATPTPVNYVVTTSNYTYAIDNNFKSAMLQLVSTTDSKNQTISRKVFHPNDAGVPLINGPTELQAQTAMQAANRINVPMHEVDTRNGVITEKHYTYATGAGSNNGFTNTYLASTTLYNTISGTQIQSKQSKYNFDQTTSNAIASSSYSGPSVTTPQGKYLAVGYGYNASLPVAQIDNAVATSTGNSSPTTLSGNCALNGSGSTFTITSVGTITLSVSLGSPPGSSNTTTVTYTLTGPSFKSGNLCLVASGGGTCGSTPSSVSFTGMPSGTYTLSASGSSTNPSSNPYLYFSYPGMTISITNSAEFFYEGFEQSTTATVGLAHSGNMYLNTNYTVTYAPPDSRTYLIQWWNLSGGVWNFNEQTYAQNMVLTGPVDDIRVFPSDALMTSATYTPMVGKTSETDPSGKTISYQYDGLNRLQTIRDQNNNVLKQYAYQYSNAVPACHPSFIFNSSVSYIQGSFTVINSTVHVALIIYWPAGYTTLNIGNIGSTCALPNATRTIPISILPSGAIFNLIITPTGNVTAQLVSGTPPASPTTIGLVNVYDLNVATYYSATESGTFTRNNCPGGETPTSVVYTVPPYIYASTTDQNTANQLAINALNTNGQNYANTNGTCLVPATFTAATGYTVLGTPSILVNGNTVTASIAVRATTTPNWTTTLTIGTMGGAAIPSTTQNFNVVVAGDTWSVTINTTGVVTVKITGGTAPPSNVISLPNFSYSK